MMWHFLFDARIREWGRLLGIGSTLHIRMSVSEPSCCPSACLSCGTCLYWNRFSAQPHKPDQRTNAKMLTVGLSKLIIIYMNKFLRYKFYNCDREYNRLYNPQSFSSKKKTPPKDRINVAATIFSATVLKIYTISNCFNL